MASIYGPALVMAGFSFDSLEAMTLYYRALYGKVPYATLEKYKNSSNRIDHDINKIKPLLDSYDVITLISTTYSHEIVERIIELNPWLKDMLVFNNKVPAYNRFYTSNGPKLRLWVFSRHPATVKELNK